MKRRIATVMALGVAALGLSACSDDDTTASGGETELTVLAAASLTETFTALADEFESTHPGVTVALAFDSSATLAGQAVAGAPADVLATADAATMQDAVDGGAVEADPDSPARFATNVMTLVVPADNPAGITSFADLDEPGVDYVVCVDTAPCGKVGAALLTANEVTADPASLETDVKSVLAKVASDEADAGLVYVTDATAAGDRRAVDRRPRRRHRGARLPDRGPPAGVRPRPGAAVRRPGALGRWAGRSSRTPASGRRDGSGAGQATGAADRPRAARRDLPRRTPRGARRRHSLG